MVFGPFSLWALSVPHSHSHAAMAQGLWTPFVNTSPTRSWLAPLNDYYPASASLVVVDPAQGLLGAVIGNCSLTSTLWFRSLYSVVVAVVVVVTGTVVFRVVVLVCLFFVLFVVVSGKFCTRSVTGFFRYVVVLYR